MTSLLELRGIEKSFGTNRVLDAVNLRVDAGRIVALAGENGAGKSTLIKIIGGIYQRDGGEILLNGMPVKFTKPSHAMDAGVGIIHQELNLLPDMSVAENIFLGRVPTKMGKIQWQTMYDEAREYLTMLGQEIDPKTRLGSLSIAQQQMVEVAKALSLKADVLVFDEPTDALTDNEAASLFRVMNGLREQGKGLVFISHRLGEIFDMCDDIAILRDGQMVHQSPVADIDENTLIKHMVGRELSDQYPFVPAHAGAVRLEVEGLSAHGCQDVSFTARAGEVVGFSGLVGAGRTELAKAIFGANPVQSGTIKIDGAPVTIRNPRGGIRAKVGYVTEDRKTEGLVQSQTLYENAVLTGIDKFTNRFGMIDTRAAGQSVASYIDAFRVKTSGPNHVIAQLSGGNQQKVSIAKSLMAEPDILILDEPTRGVDVGAKREIYTLINQLKADGMCIILISSDMPELLGISDRILVMSEGRVTGAFDRAEATQENIMQAAVAGH